MLHVDRGHRCVGPPSLRNVSMYTEVESLALSDRAVCISVTVKEGIADRLYYDWICRKNLNG